MLTTLMLLFAKVQPFLTVINTVFNLVLTLIILPFARKLFRLRQEWWKIANKQFLENVEVVCIGVQGGKVFHMGIGGFHTVEFGERLFKLIVRWNDKPSDDVIDPGDAVLCGTIRTVLRMRIPPMFQTNLYIESLLKGAVIHDDRGFRFRKLVACLIRPDADKIPAWHDSPRVILIEESALHAIHTQEIVPLSDDLTGQTLHASLKLVAKTYAEERRELMEIFHLPAIG